MNTASDDFRPSASWKALEQRSSLLKKLRRYFDQHDFIEVTTPVLSADTVIDVHLDPFRVTNFDDPRQPKTGPTWYLQTSPEFHMKRLLSSGGEAIYQIGPAFRAAESGPIHNREFTMVEWYRVGDDMQAGMRRLAEISTLLFELPTDERSYGEAFQEFVGINPHAATMEQLYQAGENLRPAIRNDSRTEAVNFLWSHLVEPKLGQDHPQIIYDYPSDQAALARVRDEDPPVAERFELYFRGVELANGYHELTDVEELKSRNSKANEERQRAGKPPLPADSRLLAAMRHGLPAAAGVAMGFDRVAMLTFGYTKISEVLTFPDELA